MEGIILQDLYMDVESESYVDAMHTILTHQGWIGASKPILSGMTAAAFRFTVNRRLTGESATAYNWMAENFVSADFLGITTGQSAGFSFSPTFPLYQEQAVLDIKKSIDRGCGAVFWKDSFMIAAGYDDHNQVLYYSDGSGGRYLTLSYEEFGINRSPYWYYQVFEDMVPLDEIEVYKESLMQAVYKWEEHDLMLPEADYACGNEAYNAVLQALQTGEFDWEGAREVFRCYAASKRDIHIYMLHLERIWPPLSPAVHGYRRAADLFHKVLLIARDPHDESGVISTYESLDSKAEELICLFTEAQQAENMAVQHIKWFMRERIDNRFQDIGLR